MTRLAIVLILAAAGLYSAIAGYDTGELRTFAASTISFLAAIAVAWRR